MNPRTCLHAHTHVQTKLGDLMVCGKKRGISLVLIFLTVPEGACVYVWVLVCLGKRTSPPFFLAILIRCMIRALLKLQFVPVNLNWNWVFLYLRFIRFIYCVYAYMHIQKSHISSGQPYV